MSDINLSLLRDVVTTTLISRVKRIVFLRQSRRVRKVFALATDHLSTSHNGN
jgi:hypothetical protein